MTTIPRTYIVNEANERIAVQLDIQIFEKLEEAVEDNILSRILAADNESEILDAQSAKIYYEQLQKAE